MVAQYTVFGRQVGSHVVSLFHLFPSSLPSSLGCKRLLTSTTVKAFDGHPGNNFRLNSVSYGR